MPPSSPGLPSLPAEKRVSLNSVASHASSPRIGVHFGDVENEADIESRENADALNEIIMAIDLKDRGTLGCAYYVARCEKLFVMEDIKLSTLDIVDSLKLHASPTVILISTKSDEALEEHLTESKDAGSGDNPGM